MSSDRPPPNVIEVEDGFWNLRGSFKIGGVVDVGTQASLVRLASGKYVFLDACQLTDAMLAWVRDRTGGGDDIEAVLHLHPFHTMHVRRFVELFPKAKLHGTARHLTKLSDLSWEPLRTEDAGLHERYAEDFDFSVPRGVDFISKDEHLHFSSVLAFHKPSKTLHVDDTLTYVRMPGFLRSLKADLMMFHPTLAKVLEHRPGAAHDLREWARELIERSRDVKNLCAAHSATLLDRKNRGASVAHRIEGALQKIDGKLKAHERRYG